MKTLNLVPLLFFVFTILPIPKWKLKSCNIAGRAGAGANCGPCFDCTNCEIIDQLKKTTIEIIEQIQESTEEININNDENTEDIVEVLNEINTSIKSIGGAQSCVTVLLNQTYFNPVYTVTASGKYVMCQSVNLTTTGMYAAAINVIVSDVLIDLNGHAVTYSGSDSDIYGVLIDEGLSNVSVVNSANKSGALRGFTGAGIKVDADSSDVVDQVNVLNVTLNNNTVGVDLNYVNNLLIQSCTISSNEIGVRLQNLQNGRVFNSVLDRNLGSSAVYGLHLAETTTNVTVINSSFQCNLSTGGNVIGLFAENATGLVADNCIFSFNSTSGAGASAAGAWLVDCFNSKVTNSNIASNIGIASSYGLNILNTVYSSFLSNQLSNNVYGINDNATKSTNLYMQNMAFSNTTNYNVSYGVDGSLLIHTSFPSGLDSLINASLYGNIEIKDTP